jgi:hypothetical protein
MMELLAFSRFRFNKQKLMKIARTSVSIIGSARDLRLAKKEQFEKMCQQAEQWWCCLE